MTHKNLIVYYDTFPNGELELNGDAFSFSSAASQSSSAIVIDLMWQLKLEPQTGDFSAAVSS